MVIWLWLVMVAQNLGWESARCSLWSARFENNVQSFRMLCFEKGTFSALCVFPWARVEISRVSRARRVRKQATIKFDQWFIYKLISLHDLHARSPRAPSGKNTGLKRCPFCPFCPICPWKSTINFVLQIVLLIWKVKGCKDCEKSRFCK